MRFNSDCSLLVYMLTCIQYFAVDGTMPQKHGIALVVCDCSVVYHCDSVSGMSTFLTYTCTLVSIK